jgi:hypothetical protein
MLTGDLLTVADLARRWRTTKQAIYSARHRGDCPPALRVARRLLWRAEDVDAWERERLEPASLSPVVTPLVPLGGVLSENRRISGDRVLGRSSARGPATG